MGYADDHSLLRIIPDKTDHIAAASDLNSDLVPICNRLFDISEFVTFSAKHCSAHNF